MQRIGIIRCHSYSENCSATGCFAALYGRAAAFAPYPEVEIVAMDTCGGCGRGSADKVKARAERQKSKGAEVIHLSNCMIGACPWKDLYAEAIRGEVGVQVAMGTHA